MPLKFNALVLHIEMPVTAVEDGRRMRIGVRLSPFGTLVTGLLYQPRTIDDDHECRAVGGKRIGKGNRSTRRKPDLGSNPGCRWGKTSTNRLSCGTAHNPVEVSKVLSCLIRVPYIL
jgi:hypothetical protein